MGLKLKAEQYECIVTERLAFGTPVEKVANMLNCGKTSVNNISAMFKAVQDGDWDRVCKIISQRQCPFDAIQWAADKCGVELPQKVLDEWEIVYAPKPETPPKPAPEPAPEPAPPLPPPDHWAEGKVMLQTIVKALNQQNELLEQLYDVVLPKWVGDLKDNFNVNSDQLHQALKRIEDMTEAIKINVRKRGM